MPTKILTAKDFPPALVNAIGDDTIAKMNQVTVQERGTGYLADCFSLEMIQKTEAVKGTDQLGRIFVAFPVTHQKTGEDILCIIFQRYSGRNAFWEVCRDPATGVDKRPQWGDAFSASHAMMTEDKYAFVRSIFRGWKRDLKPGLSQEKHS